MDKLKQLVASKRKAADEEFGGKKFVKRSELEEQRLKKLREEEERERSEKTAKRQKREIQQDTKDSVPAAAEKDLIATAARTAIPTATPPLSKDQVIRRLRTLKQPTTMFGETDQQRYERLLQAEKTVQVDDETAGGQQENLHIALQREEKEKAIRKQLQEEQPHQGEMKEEIDEEQQRLMAQFQAAAEALAEKNMALEDRILKWMHKWMKDWQDDLDSRDDAVKASAVGRQSDVRFKETEQYLRPLYARLKNRSLDVNMLAGIKLMVDAMKERNYLHAYKIYMGVAIGNSPWPIGVTQVGLHERSAREKISFKYSSGSAHIMNDEATRKFIQALKRLMTFCQRRYPTDPSRSVDFDGFVDQGRGSAGAGSDKVALLEAYSRGEAVAPAPAPSVVDERGAVKIPEKWDQVLKSALKEVAASDAADEGENGGGKI